MTLDDSEDDVAPQTWKALGIATFIVLLVPAVYISVQAYLRRNSVPESRALS